MSSPIYEKTRTSTAITSKDINILSERIYIKISRDFKTAKFVIEYRIQSNVDGMQIPLLFFAKDYKDSFLVWVDDKEVNIQDIPKEYISFNDSIYNNFGDYLPKERMINDSDYIRIRFEENEHALYEVNELKYFETDISKGIHTIRVEYNAEAWENMDNWVTEYSFRYSLTPAKYWKSFGTLEVIVEQEGEIKQIVSNLGKPNEQNIQAKNTWSFNKLPAEYLNFSYVPKVNFVANILILIQPFGLTIIVGILTLFLHFQLIKAYRKKKPNKRYSVTLILTSIIAPLLILIFYINSFYLIDAIIGETAGNHHGYEFLAILLYPIVLIVYGIFVWFADVLVKEKLLKQKK